MSDTDNDAPFDPASLTVEELVELSSHDDGRLADLASAIRGKAEQKQRSAAAVPAVSAKVAAQIRSENRILTARAIQLEKQLEAEAAAEDAARAAEAALVRSLSPEAREARRLDKIDAFRAETRAKDPLRVKQAMLDYGM